MAKTQSTKPVYITSGHTTAELEAFDWDGGYVHPVAIDPIECDGRHYEGRGVILTSRDGDTFIGEIESVDEYSLRIYIALS